jgi:His/Glu/Gln/Arg/opine family amino acid ABC transporter permease subunit
MGTTKTFWDWVGAIISNYGQMFLSGAGTTMLIAITGTIIGFLIGLIVAIVRTIPVLPQDNKAKKVILKIANAIMAIYIEVFRGTPMMVQAMIVYYGLNEKIGNISYYDSTGQSDYTFTKPYSEKTAQEIDEEVHKLIERSYNKAKEILLENKEKHAQLAQLLLDREVIFAEDLEKIFGKRPFGQQNDSIEASQDSTSNDNKQDVNSQVNNNGEKAAGNEENSAQPTV